MKRNQKGFSVVELAVLLVLAVAVGLIGYKLYGNNNSPKQTASLPAKIQSKSDLKQAAQALDAQNIKGSMDTTQLDNGIKQLL